MLNTLAEVLPEAARRFGDKIALVIGDQEFSFRDLDELSNALAASLVKLGSQPGDRVTLYAPNSWEWIVSYYGALKTGAVINPINVILTPAEVAYVTRDCGAKALIGSADKVFRARSPPASTASSPSYSASSADARTLRRSRIRASRCLSSRSLSGPDALSTIGYTSGTTGHPKGAMQSHRAVILNGAMTAQMHLKTPARCCRQRAAVPACLRQRRVQRRDALWPEARLARALRRRRDV